MNRQLEYPHTRYPPLQAWLETLGQKRDEKLGIVDLHPSIWQTSPRYKNILRCFFLNLKRKQKLDHIDWIFSMKMSNGRRIIKKL